MTSEAPAEREYIISEFQLNQLQGYAHEGLVASFDIACQAIRSRPLPEHDKQVRESVLDMVYKRLEGQCRDIGPETPTFVVEWLDIECLFEELRQGDKIC